MKWLVWILLILNFALLGFFIASSYVAEPVIEPVASAPDTSRIKILTPEALAALPKKAPPPAPIPVEPQVQKACYEWSGFTAADAPRVRLSLKHLGLQATPKIQPNDPKTSTAKTWVYIPSLTSMPKAEARVAELQLMGVEDSFIVQEPKWRYAISLGLFKDEALANNYLQKLRGMGVKNAVKLKRDNGHGNTQTSYLINNISPAEAHQLNELKPHFPGSELNPLDCR